MHISIHTKDIVLNAPLKTFIEEKLADVARVVGTSGDSSVTFEVGIPSHHHHKGQVFYAEANLTMAGTLFRAEATGYDLHAAIVDVKEELTTQIRKFKERARDDKRHASTKES